MQKWQVFLFMVTIVLQLFPFLPVLKTHLASAIPHFVALYFSVVLWQGFSICASFIL